MSKLANSVVLVIGGTGNIGSGAVAAFLKAGSTVIAPSRTEKSLEILKTYLKKANIPTEKLTGLPGISISDPKDAEKLAGIVKERFKGLDHVVCSSGPWWNTPALHQLDFETFRKAGTANVDAHFLAWRFLGPLVIDRPGSSFTFVNGAAKNSPQAGLTSALATSVGGLVSVINVQTKALPVRTNELLIAVRVESDEDFEANHLTPTDSLTHSSVFGKLFPALALSNHKSETINVFKMSQLDEIVKAAGL
ncbi:Outer membrane efflux protein [Dinochytrium kinnereticum]|nr:Outer membrane efflux protein [Dinochytrium kinnereticum]